MNAFFSEWIRLKFRTYSHFPVFSHVKNCHSNKDHIDYVSYVTPLGSPDIRKSTETLVWRDRAQYGAEDIRGAGRHQESQGTFWISF